MSVSSIESAMVNTTPRTSRTWASACAGVRSGSEERTVADCFRQVLRLDQVGIHDDFLDLGGDSLLATELLVTMESRLGITCSTALISHSFSVALITDRLHQPLPESAVVLLQAGNGRAPLFCIQNYEGHVLEYYRLVHCLGPDQTVYGVQNRAFTRSAALDESVETIATAFVRDVTALGITGPYHLCGNCFGGVVAYEMASCSVATCAPVSSGRSSCCE